MAAGVQEFRVGSVISRGIGVFMRNIVPFVIASFLAFLPAVIVSLLLIGTAAGTMAVGDPAAMHGGMAIMVIIVMIVYIVCYFWVTAALTWGVVMDLRGARPSIGAMLGGSLRALGPVVMVGIVVGLMVGFGAIFFIIPGIILLCMFWVSVPAAVVEQQGVGAALARSRALTKGRRWGIFAVLVIWVVIAGVVQSVLATVLGVAAEGGGAADIVLTLVNMLLGGIGASINAVGYHDLRIEKEGGDTEAMARNLG